MKTLLKIVLFSGVIFASIGGFLYWEFFYKGLDDSRSSVLIEVRPGQTLHQVVNELKAKDISIPQLQYKVWARLTEAHKKLHVGEFELSPHGKSPAQVLTEILEADSKGYKITIVEGLNLWEIEKIFAAPPLNVPPETYQKWIRDPARLDRMKIPVPSKEGVARTLEGYLYPETYMHYKYSSPEDIIDQMLTLFEENMGPLLDQHDWGNTAQGRHDLITLASIVEKESQVLDEQPTIASVYWNRIEKGMRLQADPTTIYGLMPGFNGNITRKNLREKNAYNTYMMKGLPAGPIANPGKHTLAATVDPATTEYFFFVSKNDGSHIFSKDYATHNKWVDEYQRKRRKRTKQK